MNDNINRNVKASTADHVDSSAESSIGVSGGIISPISQLLDRPRFPSMCLESVTLTFRNSCYRDRSFSKTLNYKPFPNCLNVFPTCSATHKFEHL